MTPNPYAAPGTAPPRGPTRVVRSGLERFARISRVAAVAIIGVAVLGVLTGGIHSWRAISLPTLSAIDRRRTLAAGIAEAFYNAFFVLPGALLLAASAWASWRVRRGRPPGGPSGEGGDRS
jgi:hypothetical protein